MIAGLWALVFLAGCAGGGTKSSNPATACEERRAAWDLGSGSVKVKAAVVNTCELKIVKVLLDESQKANFKEDLDRSAKKEFRETTRAEARRFIAQMKEKLKDLEVDKHLGVATAAFREAANGPLYLESLNRELGINVKLITQKEEGMWGYNAAQTKLPRVGQKALVWDIGGGSQQLVTPAENGQILVVESNIASVSFKNWLLRETKKKGPSPNPLTKEEADLALTHALKQGTELRAKLPASVGNEAYGIGGVHSTSLVNRMKKMSYGTDDLEKAIERGIGQNDAALKSAYAATEVTNLIFVLGMMRGLGLEKVHSLKVSLTDGLLVFGHY
ncbi:MAG: hypothetical protein KF767_17525 [Bdellovibrionaceae bacterium]|nr:hypothetical protein [Pseudobdellovibrionaceae bacterium]